MSSWGVSGDGRSWSVELDVRDLGCHSDFTRRARAGLSPAGCVMLFMGLRWLMRCRLDFSLNWVS